MGAKLERPQRYFEVKVSWTERVETMMIVGADSIAKAKSQAREQFERSVDDFTFESVREISSEEKEKLERDTQRHTN